MANKKLKDALLQNSKAAVTSGRSATAGVSDQTGFVWLPLAEIQPDPEQPRTHIDEAALRQLAESIRALGQIEPILVQPLRAEDVAPGAPHRYRCMSGHRRLRALEELGIDEVKAVIVRDSFGPGERLMHEIASNEARQDHTDFDRAIFLTTVFAEKLAFGVEDAADRVKYAVNRAFNEQDRAGKLSDESQAVVTACEEALSALGERRNLRWFHRWGLPVMALDGASRDAALRGLDARRTLTIAQLAAKRNSNTNPALREEVISRVGTIALSESVPNRFLSMAVKDLNALLGLDPPDIEAVDAVLARLHRSDDLIEDLEPSTPKRRASVRRTTAPLPVAEATVSALDLTERARKLSSRWTLGPEAGDGGLEGLIERLPNSERHRADRFLDRLERADAELVKLLKALLR
ncbi:MAG: ParB/RepB/Spo0J family partition protein [Blastocatellia bacterium]|nr:ParB/RepB/Spo0J family partition protein [Blastocatellia bacterium]